MFFYRTDNCNHTIICIIYVEVCFNGLAPLFMTTPTVTPESGSEFNVEWTEPDLVDRRGAIISYSIYNYQMKESDDPFAPPYSWQVKI